jgi:hypothetical protein
MKERDEPEFDPEDDDDRKYMTLSDLCAVLPIHPDELIDLHHERDFPFSEKEDPSGEVVIDLDELSFWIDKNPKLAVTLGLSNFYRPHLDLPDLPKEKGYVQPELPNLQKRKRRNRAI